MSYVADHMTALQGLVPEQYKRAEKLNGLVASVMHGCDQVETMLQELRGLWDVHSMEGVNLDIIGAVVGVKRKPSETDTGYRVRLLAGPIERDLPTYEALRSVVRAATGSQYVGLYPVWPAGVFVVVDTGADLLPPLLDGWSASGVEALVGTFLRCEDDGPYICDEDHGQPFVIDGVRQEGLVIDGLTYRTAVMPDGREWMVENLQAAQGSATFYKNDEATYGRNGKNYGRLYNWEDAVAIADRVDGWHLPTSDEWDALLNAIGTGVAGTRLKAVSGWSSGNGTDNYGFSAFPAGYHYSGSFYNVGSNACFWTATERSSTGASFRFFSTGESIRSYGNDKIILASSVRLIKDI